MIGIIGGSGLYELEGLEVKREEYISTPFGEPSSPFMIGEIEGIEVAFLARHGKGHIIPPSELNNRANIYAFKKLGTKYIVSISAVGSLKEELKPLDIVIPNQLFDRTRLRDSSFFSSGLVVHISFAEPFCERLCELIYKEAKDKKINVHQNGVYVCIEGPQFSTRAESQFYRSMGFDIIGMTALPEAKLAREASICYAIIAVVTDYDVWYKPEESVTAEMIIENLKKGINKAKIILKEVLPKINQLGECQLCHHALKDAIVTQKDFIKEEIKEKFYHLIKEYENIT